MWIKYHSTGYASAWCDGDVMWGEQLWNPCAPRHHWLNNQLRISLTSSTTPVVWAEFHTHTRPCNKVACACSGFRTMCGPITTANGMRFSQQVLRRARWEVYKRIRSPTRIAVFFRLLMLLLASGLGVGELEGGEIRNGWLASRFGAAARSPFSASARAVCTSIQIQV